MSGTDETDAVPGVELLANFRAAMRRCAREQGLSEDEVNEVLKVVDDA